MEKLFDGFRAKALISNVFLFVVVFAVNLSIGIVFYKLQLTSNFDVAVFMQAQERYSNLQIPIIPLLKDQNVLGNHFSPILALLAPLYALWPGPYMLLATQAFCMALAAVIFASTAAQLIGGKFRWLAGLSLGLSFGFLVASEAAFHEYAIALPILAWSLRLAFLDRYLAASIWAIPLLLVKEDMGFLLFGLGIAYAWRARKWRYLLLSLLGTIAVALAVYVIMPALAGSSWSFSSFISISERGITTAWWQKFMLIAVFIVQGAVVAVASPYFLAVMSFVGLRLFSTWSPYYDFTYYYNMATMVLISFALLDYLHKKKSSELLKVLSLSMGLVLSLTYITVGFSYGEGKGKIVSYVTIPWEQRMDRIEVVADALDEIPAESTVRASQQFANPLVEKGLDVILLLDSDLDKKADCYVNDGEEIKNASGQVQTTVDDVFEKLEVNPTVVAKNDYVTVWCN